MRAFVAVEISDQQILSSIRDVQSEIRISARPVEPCNMHFTLLFLGEISDEMAARVAGSLKEVQFAQFQISFEGIGAFPKPRFPRVVWIGVKEGRDELVQLAGKVEERLATLGFKADKPFAPHVTIFRIKDKSQDITDQLSKYASTKLGTQLVSEVKLKKSVLTPQGPVYSDLEVVRAK